MPLAVGIWLMSVLLFGRSLLPTIERFLEFVRGASFSRSAGIGERFSLFGSPDRPLILFGLILVVAIPRVVGMAIEVLRERRPGWLVMTVYAWF
jgi:hypothetical protein